MCKSLTTLKNNLEKGSRRLSKVTVKNIVNAKCFDRIELAYSYDGYDIHKGDIIENPIEWFNDRYDSIETRIYKVENGKCIITLSITQNLWYNLVIDLNKDYSKETIQEWEILLQEQKESEEKRIQEEKTAKKAVKTATIAERKELEEQVKNIKPLKVENVENKNIRINVLFPSLNKNNTIEEYKEELERKYNTNKTLICEIITLSNADYELFTHNFLCDCDFIAGKGGNRSDFESDKDFYSMNREEQEECIKLSYTLGILVQNEDGEQIIVDPQGYNYARYVGFLEEPLTTPEPPKPRKKIDLNKREIKDTNNNIVDLSTYRATRATTKAKATNTITSEERATKKQLYALHVGSKLNTTNLIISKEDASKLIKKSMQGINIHDEVKQLLKQQQLKQVK